MTVRPSPGPYGSAHDLPSFVELRQSLAGMKLLTRVIARDQRQAVLDLDREIRELCDLVDRFYDVLGDRHWIFTESLSTVDVGALLTGSTTPEEAESGLIRIMADRISGDHWRMGLLGHPALRARSHNLERARSHYQEGQWDSCALVLVTIMDGFVNDVERAVRRGLHARSADEMVAWDSVIGHHKGLSAVMPRFLRPFKRRHDDEVFEVHRHGIVHGTVIRYNNQIVATKAWNLLGAVVDWATAARKAQEPVEPKTTFRQTVALIAERARAEQARKDFEPWSTLASAEGFEELDVIVNVRAFLEAWKSRRWGIAARWLPSIITRDDASDGRRARRARDVYERMPLDEFQLVGVSFPMFGAATVHGTATIGDRVGPIEMRWMLEGEDGNPAKPGDRTAQWALAVYPPEAFFVTVAD